MIPDFRPVFLSAFCLPHNHVASYSIITQVKGILGASVLCLHQPLDLIKAVVVDDLHCLFLGVTKHLISLWFSDKYKSFDFYIGGKVSYYT